MFGIYALAWPILGLVMASLFIMLRTHADGVDVLLGSAFAASVGGALGYLAAAWLVSVASAAMFGLVGAMGGAILALLALDRRAHKNAPS